MRQAGLLKPDLLKVRSSQKGIYVWHKTTSLFIKYCLFVFDSLLTIVDIFMSVDTQHLPNSLLRCMENFSAFLLSRVKVRIHFLISPANNTSKVKRQYLMGLNSLCIQWQLVASIMSSLKQLPDGIWTLYLIYFLQVSLLALLRFLQFLNALINFTSVKPTSVVSNIWN